MSTNHPHPSLPSRPAASNSNPFPLPPANLFIDPANPSSSSSSSSAKSGPPCIICASPSKYSCPGCGRSTCSAPCSKAHKSQYGCSGQRNPSSFVPLNSYGQGTWGDDFRYLEESRRKILGWGEALPRESLVSISSTAGAGRGMGRGGRGGVDIGRGGRGRGGRGGGGGGGGLGHLSNAERRVSGWKREMQRRGVWVDVMPEGMSRRKMNASGWNPKTQIIHLTVHLSIPSDLLDTPSGTSPSIISHPRALFTSPSSPSSTLISLLPPAFPSESLSSVVFLLPFQPSPNRPTPPAAGKSRPRLFFPPLDPHLPLDQVLRGTAWIEFPVVHVMRSHTWIVLKAKGEMGVVPLADVGPYVPSVPSTGRGKGKLVQEVKANGTAEGEASAKAAMGGLADYASDEDGDGDDYDLHLDDVDDETEILPGTADDEEGAEEEEEDEEDVAGILGAIDIPGGADMMQKVSEALLADFGHVDGDENEEDEGEVVMKEVETRRE